MTSSVTEATRCRASRGAIFAAVLGGVMACLTLSLESLNPGVVLVSFLFPGMLGAIALSGNAHAWHLWEAALVNGIFYFGLGWIASRLSAKILRKAGD